jgi:hypothetical protein
MEFFIRSELCKRFKTVAGDTPRASTSEYIEENGSLSKHANDFGLEMVNRGSSGPRIIM